MAIASLISSRADEEYLRDEIRAQQEVIRARREMYILCR
jgi:hypothetical protein